MECTYNLWTVAITHSFVFGLGVGAIFYTLKYVRKDENGRVGRDSKGRFTKR